MNTFIIATFVILIASVYVLLVAASMLSSIIDHEQEEFDDEATK